MILRSLLLSAALLLSSCSSIQYVTNCIEIPAQPEKPVLTVEQDSAIPDDTYQILGKRELIDQAYIKALKSNIEANNSRCK